MTEIKDNFYSYDELRDIVKKIGIKRKDDYIEKYRIINDIGEKRAPSNPNSFYRDEWENWSLFLGKKIYKKKHHNLYYSYQDCKETIQTKSLKSKLDFFNNINKIMDEDIRIPYNPYKVYGSEWEGWGIFLGTNNVQNKLIKYKKYNEAKEWAHKLNLKTQKEWRRLDINKLPSDIPKKPDRTYKNKGWIDWYDWLGVDRNTKVSYGESLISRILDNMRINYIHDKSLEQVKEIFRFDFYIPEKNICIEFDGIQHFKPVEIFGGVDGFNELKKRDELKNLICKNENIKLIRIPYTLSDNEIYNIIKREV